MDSMDDLVQWLRAQLDADAELSASGETWTAFDESTQGTRRVDVDHSFERVVACTRAWRGLHIAEHDPARVLREIDTKRRILRDLEQAELTLTAAEPGTSAHDLMTGAVNTLRRTARLHAEAYDQRPGYREGWRP